MATKEEVGAILTTIEVAYPAYYKNISPNMITATLKLWAEMFAETDANDLAYATKLYIANNTDGFPPSIGKLNEIMRDAHGGLVTEIEAWQMIKKAIRNSYDLDSAKTEWNKLPYDVSAVIKPTDLLDWGQLPSDVVNTTISAAYRRSFTAKQKKEQEQNVLPQTVRQLLTVKRIE